MRTSSLRIPLFTDLKAFLPSWRTVLYKLSDILPLLRLSFIPRNGCYALFLLNFKNEDSVGDWCLWLMILISYEFVVFLKIELLTSETCCTVWLLWWSVSASVLGSVLSNFSSDLSRSSSFYSSVKAAAYFCLALASTIPLSFILTIISCTSGWLSSS